MRHFSRQAGPRSGFTLIESVVSLGVFTIICLGVLAVVIQIRRLAENNVYENTALTMAQGYVEQLRSLPYGELVNVSTAGTAVLPLLSANGAGALLTDGAGGALNDNEWTRETVTLDRDASGRDTQPMVFQFRVDLADLRALTTAGANGVEITITYEYIPPDGRNRAVRRTLRTVRSVVPSY